VTITIIGIMAGMMMGALQMARNSGKESATKATITKLNSIIMQRYESYMTRRVPIQIPVGTTPAVAARMRLDAIRDLMRMEMPDHYADIANPQYSYGWGSVPEPALHRLYNQKYTAKAPTAGLNELAKCLFLVVSLGSPEAMEQFNQSEIGIDSDGWQYFIDGNGASISFLRWAPGVSSPYTSPLGFPGFSDVQSGDAVNDHDPFDTRNIDAAAFRLVPLIYSSYGLTDASCLFSGGSSYKYQGNPFATFTDPVSSKSLYVGTPTSNAMAGIITNHHIEQR